MVSNSNQVAVGYPDAVRVTAFQGDSMKLYYSPGACSLSPHIVARELGLALELDSGEVLTEGPAIVQYLADLKPEKGLAAANGTPTRYRLQEMLGYINSEIHKTYSPLFKSDTPEQTRAERKEYLRKRYALIEDILAKQTWLLGDHFSVADAYLFTVTNWARHVDFDLSAFKALNGFQQRVAARPAVQTAMQEEGLIKRSAAA